MFLSYDFTALGFSVVTFLHGSSGNTLKVVLLLSFSRLKGPCPHYLEVCCKTDEAGGPTTPTLPVSQPNPSSSEPPGTDQPTPRPLTQDRYQSRGCGFRNVDGVGFRIIGTKNEAQFGEFPWVVALLGENEKFICGASLIHPKVVLTSSHCVRT